MHENLFEPIDGLVQLAHMDGKSSLWNEAIVLRMYTSVEKIDEEKQF